MIGKTKPTTMREIHDAYEAIAGAPKTSVFLTCEHASERLPAGYSWPEADRWLVGTHWAYDLGAADIVRELAEALEAPAVLSRFSRLLIDPNRSKDDATLFREEAEGRRVFLNTDLTDEERARRIQGYYVPFHEAIDGNLGPHGAEILFSIHSFTPVYEGETRPMEIGVLFNTQDDLGQRATRHLEDAGFVTVENEPYSGKAGLIYSAEHHAGNHDRKALELEVRQDLSVQPEFRARLVDALARFFS
jgi:predicted N-formylglutamate amidohydrolase